MSDRRRLPDIPVGETWRFSLGLETALSENTTLGLSYTLAWMPDMKLDNVDLPPQFNTSLKGEFVLVVPPESDYRLQAYFAGKKVGDERPVTVATRDIDISRHSIKVATKKSAKSKAEPKKK